MEISTSLREDKGCIIKKLIIVLPCYNEEEVLELSIEKISSYVALLIKKCLISKESYCCFVDDGSTDTTWDIITNSSSGNTLIKGIKLSRNFGHQNALLAGLEQTRDKADMFITMDCDLQDDICAIEAMVDAFYSGSEIVYAVRDNRESDTIFKRKSAEIFYALQKYLGIDSVYNHADYRLISNRASHFLDQYRERNLFLRAIFPLIGLKSYKIYYKRQARPLGESKYPLFKMFSFAIDGITSFSTRPLKVITVLGLFISLFSLLMTLYIILIKLFSDLAIPGWASTVVPIYFIGGIQLLSIGVLGEYVGKIYSETKQRPHYLIEKESSGIS